MTIIPSVTHILRKTMPESKKIGLQNWKERIGIEQAEKICQESKERGIVIHDLIEHNLKQKKKNIPPEYQAIWQHLEPIIGKIEKPLQVEQPVVHQSLAYQGRFDLLAYWEGRLTIFDFKTSNKPKIKEWLEDEFIQVAAYAGALESMGELEVEQGLLIVACPEETQLFNLSKEALEEYWYQWLEKLAEFSCWG